MSLCDQPFLSVPVELCLPGTFLIFSKNQVLFHHFSTSRILVIISFLLFVLGSFCYLFRHPEGRAPDADEKAVSTSSAMPCPRSPGLVHHSVS